VKKDNKTYNYAQLVESYRRADGKPRQRVIASLGKLTDLEVANLRLALKAAKAGEGVVCLQPATGTPVVRSSLDYLPIAVVLEMSRRIGLTALLSRLLDDDATSMPASKVVLALVAHRLLAPGSKLAAVRWFERTALPELLGVEPGELNNSRIHRILDALSRVRPELQLGVAQLHNGDTQKGHALFIDVSDTWFEGRGPELAQRAKTKEGAYKKKIGIVLTCNKRGQPIRWDVVEGRLNDCKSMGDMAAQLVHIPGLAKLPMVFDRAMGKKKTLQELTDAGVRFVTMMTRDSFEGYAGELLVFPKLAESQPEDEDDVQAQAAALSAVQEEGFVKIGRMLWGKALGVRRHRVKKRDHRAAHAAVARPVRQPARVSRPNAVHGMRKAEEIAALKEKTGARYKEVYEQVGVRRAKGFHLRRLLKLLPELRELVREGGCWASLEDLEAIAALEPGEQLEAFARYRLDAEPVEQAVIEPPQEQYTVSGPPLRLVLAFDPAAFTAARFAANDHDRELCEGIEQLNVKLAQGRCSQRSAEVTVAKLLAKHSLTDCYEVTTSRFSAQVQRREDVWQRKRRTDGFRLFAVHPDLRVSPKRVINLYSEKMAVEVDFHVIKSTVRIRPVHHGTEAKVRAHVDLCVLALAVERALRAALPDGLTAPAALEILETVRLSSVAPNPKTAPTRVLTTPTPEQQRILRRLDMLPLATPDSL